MIGYLDIETAFDGRVTVVGLLRADQGVTQLVGEAVTVDAVTELLDGVDTICTYYGDRFDLPVLGDATGLDLFGLYRSVDLYVECRRRRIRGGLKAVERRYGIPRSVTDVDGYRAMELWQRWEGGDRDAVEMLLVYNRDDVVNLATLERRLSGDFELADAPSRTIVGV